MDQLPTRTIAEDLRYSLASRTAAAFACLVFCLTPAATTAASVGELLPVGEPAPAFQSIDIDGKAFQLQEELSKGSIFLVFWSIF